MREEAIVTQWLKQFVIGHDICPFAKRPMSQGRIQITVVDSEKEEDANQALLQELSTLISQPRKTLETSLLVIPNQFEDFNDFWSYCEWTQDLLVDSGVEGLVQIVGFHPDFYFADSEKEDLANYTNRSPFPILHLLREESVSEAVEQYPAIADIPKRNQSYLRQLSKMTLERLRTGHDEQK